MWDFCAAKATVGVFEAISVPPAKSAKYTPIFGAILMGRDLESKNKNKPA
jgi:hypothetical protein